MTIARKDIYDPEELGIYHCFSRCVRRAYLCGKDPYTGKDYRHRKQWLEELLEIAAENYTTDVLSFGILDNHFHTMLRNRPDLKKKLSPAGVARRWLLLHPKRRDKNGRACEPNQREIRAITQDKKRVKVLRDRLANISWFMGYIKEKLARRANEEDDVKGAFFEKRFEMKALVSEGAVLGCSIYIDLNLVRAGIASSPETSVNTSAWRRIQGLKARRAGKKSKAAMTDRLLSPIFTGTLPKNQQFAALGWRASDKPALDMTPEQYLAMLDFSGRFVHLEKQGRIPAELAPILERLQIEPEWWIELVRSFDTLFRRVAGHAEAVEELAARGGRKWFHGLENCRKIFSRCGGD